MRLTSKLKNKWSIGAALALSLATVGAAHAEPTATAATSAVTLPKPGFLNVIWKPNTLPAALPFRQHAANWEKWALTQPANVSPLTDPDGRCCGQGQPSGLVWYLAGTFNTSTPAKRSCTIPSNRTVIVPVVNAGYGAFPSDPADQRTLDFVREQVDAEFGQPSNLSATLDGVAINVESYIVESNPTSFTLPANNIYQTGSTQVLNPFADKGYYIAFNLDPAGQLLGTVHTLKFHGVISGLTVDVTYTLKVGKPVL